MKKHISIFVLLCVVSLMQAQIPLYNEKKGFVDDDGNTIIPFEYDNVKEFSEKLAPVQKGKYWGYINLKNETVIPFEYDDANPFSEGLALVKKDERKFYIDTTGQVAFYVEGYSFCGPFSCGLSQVSLSSGMDGFLNVHGELVIGTNYEIARAFHDGVSEAYGNGHWGVINTVCDTLIPFAYSYLRGHNGQYIIRKDGKYGMIDINNNTIIPIEYDMLEWFYNGLALAMKNDKTGFIDVNNKVVVPFQYDVARGFEDGPAVVSKGNKYGYIDKGGNYVVPLKYQFGESFGAAGIAAVALNNKWGCIDTNGKIVIPINHDDVRPDITSCGYAIFKKKGKAGVYDKKGHPCIPFKYDWIEFIGGNLFQVGLGEKTGVVNSKNQIIAPIK